MLSKRASILVVIITSTLALAQQQGIGGQGGIGGSGGIQSAQSPTFQITLTNLPSGTIGLAYSQTITTAFGMAPITFSVASGALPNGLSLNTSTGVISGTPGNNAGSYTFTIQAQDSTSPTNQFATQQYTLSILCTPLQFISGTTLPPADQGVAYTFQVLMSGGIAPLAFSGANFPAGEGIASGTGIISGTPTVVGSFSPSVTVTDSCPLTPQTVSQTFSQQVNTQLSITTTSPLPAATVGTPYTTQLARAGGVAPFAWSLTLGALPAGLSLNNTTGVVSGTPTNPQTTTPTFQVSDSLAATASKQFSLTVTCPALSIATTALPAGTQNQLYSFQMQPTGGFGALAWSATGLPAGLTISSSGLISGTPTASGSFTVATTVTDSCPTQQSSTQTYTLSIAASTGALTITTANPLPSGTEGQAYSTQMAAQGGVPPYTWARTAGSLPAGLTINTAGLVSGTPTSAGTQTPTLQVTDSASTSTSGNFGITIACPALTITTLTTLPPATQSVAYSFQMASTGGIAPVTWGASGLPTGLTISNAGAISGTPSTNGTFTVTITATDSCVPTPQAVPGTFTLQVNNNLAITTTSPLPAGVLNLAYSTTLSAAGGTSPYTWAVTAGSLPTGLSLSSGGVLSGTPTVAQTTTPTIKVTDSAAANISAVFSITINAQSGADNRYCTSSGTWLGATTDGPASLPTHCMYTPLSATPSNGTVRGPDSTATTLQNDINAAACGDTILVTAGSVIQGPIVLKPKGCSNSQWITIKSTGVSNGNFPAEGTRATPCIAGIASLPSRPAYPCANVGTNLTAQIFAPSSSNAIQAPGADHYRLIGLELTRDQTAKKIIYMIVDLSGTSPITNNIIFDRVWFHGVNATNFPQTSTTDTSTTRAIYLGQSNHIAVIDSYISDFYNNGSTASNGNTDSQCIGGGVGSVPNTGWGVYKFVNNHCEGGSEGIILGGSGGPALTPPGCTFGVNCNLDVPADIEVRRNYFFAPNYWNGNTTTINATGWPNRKNGIEFKTGARILLEANVMENCWYSSQPYCYVFDFAPKNQSNAPATPIVGICPSCLVQDFVARYNYGYNYPGDMIAIYSTQDIGCTNCTTLGRRGSVHDNLVGDKLNKGSLTLTGFDGIEFLATAGPMTQITINHNSVVNGWRSFLVMSANTNSSGASGYDQMVIQDNIGTYTPASQGAPYLNGGGCGAGQTFQNFLTTCVTTSTVNHNVVFNTPNLNGWPAGNFFQTSASGVGFTSYGNGDSLFNPSNYQLLNTSPYHNAASDGLDIGANVPLVQSNIAGVRQ